MSARFAGKSVLVTGAVSGIGKAAVHLFADEGADVIAVDVNTAAQTESACAGSIMHFRRDAGDEREVAAIVATAVERHGGLDIICANAGISGGMAGLFEQSADDWQTLLRVNLIGPFLAIRPRKVHDLQADPGGEISAAL